MMGDLNSYYGSLPLKTLENSGLINLFDWLEPEERYSYVYQGSSQVLDHILVNENLEAYLIGVNVLHCNADYPLPLSDDEGFIHKSDHDPVIGTFIVAVTKRVSDYLITEKVILEKTVSKKIKYKKTPAGNPAGVFVNSRFNLIQVPLPAQQL